MLEPRNGGDARAESSGFYLVEQYKTRTDGTWALADLESVLCDLRKAVPPSRPVRARYRFVTDGRAGRLDAFNAFLADVKAVANPDDIANDEERTFGRDLTATNRQLFDHIAVATRSGTPVACAEESTVVFHLLSHFEMEFDASGITRAAEVENLLRHYAPNFGEERKIREQLVGVLVGRLSKGEMRLDTAGIDELFRHVGLSPERLHKLAALPETMDALTQRRLARLKYQPGRDVRNVPAWPKDKPVLLIAGESGAGKTWQLGRLLDACGQEREVTTLLRAAESREDLLAQAARDVWQTGLGETSDKTLVAVSHFLCELEPRSSAPRLTVALDDIQDVDLARDIVRQDWSDWGMRLVLTVPLAVARALEMTDGDAIHLHFVGDFSVDELDMLLKQNGRRWADLPPDLKKFLRNPILAGLFVELPYASVRSAPRSEHEIFEGFWQRIIAKGRPGDVGIVTALAAHMYEGRPYPLPRPMWSDVGLDDEAFGRLDAAGWLHSTESGEATFSHDRLLNWAIAKSVVGRFQSKHLSLEGMGAFLAGMSDVQDRRVSGRLAYVPMDALWLLAEDAQNADTLAHLVVRMEDNTEFGSYGQGLYVHLLPTLGQRAVPILLERLSAITTGSDGGFRVDLIGKAFANLSRQENIELKEVIDSLLSAPSRDRQKVAIAALTAAPDAHHLNRLWEIHQQRLSELEDNNNLSRHADYQASFAALRAGTVLDPGWLRNRILAANAGRERVSELGYLLNGLDHPDAPAIWKAVGDELMAKMPASKPRNLLYCIARFVDREKLDFVVKHLSHPEDFADSVALATLAVIDPIAAIDQLAEVKDSVRSFTRNQWVPALLRVQPELTRRRIRELAEADPKGRQIIEVLFGERPDDLDEAMFRFVLRALERDLREHLDEIVDGDPIWPFFPLDFLGRIVRPEFLAILQAEAGGELERMITTVACSRLRTNSNHHDHVREGARRVLILIGGEGITTLIKRELESEHFWVRHGGLNWALVRADDGIIERLTAMARRPVPRDANGKPESESYQECYQATTALALLGADAVLAEILRDSGVAEVPIALAERRTTRGSIPKALTEQALKMLQDAGSSDGSLLNALAIAWLSGDPELFAPVRAVLKRADPGSRVAAFACTALQALGDQSDDFARLAMLLVQTEANFSQGLNALVSVGDRGLALLGN